MEISEPSNRIINRRNALRLLSGGVIGSVADAAWIEPASLSVTRQDVFSGKLPPALDGLRIGLMADFHFRPDQDADLLDKIVRQVRSENLDLIALAGDFVDEDQSAYPPLMEAISKFDAKHGVFAVMGNHDGWNAGPVTTRRHFEKAGVSFLINQHSRISIRGESVAIAGTDFVWDGRPDPSRTLRGIRPETPVIALVHEPDYFDIMSGHRDILLQLSGHTHGGQCRVPWLGIAPVTVKYGRKYIQGSYSQGPSQLFVTRGVGTTSLRVRFACPPELAILRLRSVNA